MDCLVGYGDLMMDTSDNSFDFSRDDEDPEEKEFPEEVTNLGIVNRSSGSVVEVNLRICLTCQKVI